MNTVLGLITLIAYNPLNKDINYTIAIFILKNLQDIENMSIRTFSEKCFVSTTSINKFCHSLGFSTYNQFKSKLLSTIEIRKNQMKERYSNDEDKWYEILNSHYYNGENIYKQLDSIVEKIYQYQFLDIVSAVFPGMLLQSFIEDMVIMNIPVKINHLTYHNNLESYNSLVFLISLSGRFMNTYPHNYKELKKSAKEIIVFTEEKRDYEDITVHLPDGEHSEIGNLTLLAIFHIIKIKYYYKYYKG